MSMMLDGIRAGQPRFNFEEEEEEDIPIFKTCMAFIT